jgi:hypothetical protein
MQGPYCHACGQAEKGVIRHFASVMSDIADTIFNVDARIFRSILPLYFRPGFLTNEYFAGRRTRYVTPFRLFFFLSIVTFFAVQISLNLGNTKINFVGGDIGLGDSETSIAGAQTEAELQQRTQGALQKIEAAGKEVNLGFMKKSLVTAAEVVRRNSAARLAYLKARADALAKGEAAPPDPGADDAVVIGGTVWDRNAPPIQVAWLPAFANAQLNEIARHVKDNLVATRKNPGQAMAHMFSVLPQTLFVLMPVFAVLLKIVYIFKRRFYMEHLMVALHSHAFIFMSLLLLAIVQLLIDWAGTGATWILPLLKLLRAAIWAWLPIYLLLMQKNVYRQGWLPTAFKYGVVGVCYLAILAIGVVGAVIVSLAIT